MANATERLLADIGEYGENELQRRQDAERDINALIQNGQQPYVVKPTYHPNIEIFIQFRRNSAYS